MPVSKKRGRARSVSGRAKKPAGKKAVGQAPSRRSPMSVPEIVRQYLDVLTLVTGQSAAKILQDAIEAFINALDPERRDLVRKMVKSEAAAAAAGPTRRPMDRPILCCDDNEAMLFARATVLRREG